jgi:hypothetical protein
MPTRIRIIKHEAVPRCGSFEVRFSDGRPSKFLLLERPADQTAAARNHQPPAGAATGPGVCPGGAGQGRLERTAPARGGRLGRPQCGFTCLQLSKAGRSGVRFRNRVNEIRKGLFITCCLALFAGYQAQAFDGISVSLVDELP